MNIISPNILQQNLNIKKNPYYSNCSFKVQNQQRLKDENITDNKKTTKKEKKIWKYITIGSLILALVTDIIVERKIRIDDKAKIEALKKEKELANKLIKDLEEQSKKLEEEINKLIQKLDSDRNNGAYSVKQLKNFIKSLTSTDTLATLVPDIKSDAIKVFKQQMEYVKHI